MLLGAAPGDIAAFGADLGVRQSVSLATRLDWCLGDAKDWIEGVGGFLIMSRSRSINAGVFSAVVAGVSRVLREASSSLSLELDLACREVERVASSLYLVR